MITMLMTAHHRLAHSAKVGYGVTVYSAAFIAMLVAGMFDHFLWSSWFGQLLFWMIAGLLQSAFHEVHAETER